MNVQFNEVVTERNSDGEITGYKLKPRKEADIVKEFNEKFYVNDTRAKGPNKRGTGSALKEKIGRMKRYLKKKGSKQGAGTAKASYYVTRDSKGRIKKWGEGGCLAKG